MRVVLEFTYACVTLGWLLAIIAYKIGRKWEIKRLHNHFGKLYDLWTRSMPLYREVGLSVARIAIRSRPIKALDVATGTGFVLLSLAKFSQLSCGVDISFNILRIAKSKARKEHLIDIEYINADAENLCLRDRIFDVVTCNFGIFFFPNQTEAIREMTHALKPGGRLIFSTYSQIGSYVLASQFHSAKEWVRIIKKAGLSLVDMQRHTPLYMIIVAGKVS